MATVLIMGSLTSMTFYEKPTSPSGCVDQTFDAMDEMFDLGLSVSEVTCASNVFYAECTGSPVTMQDYMDCLE